MTLVTGRECRFPDGIGGSSRDETLGSEAGRGRHLLRPAEGNKAGSGANRHDVGIVMYHRGADERIHTPEAVVPEVGTQNAGD